MGMVTLVYDGEVFLDDFKDKIKIKPSKEECKEGTVIWKFPFSEEKISVINEDNGSVIIYNSYIDDKQREWVSVIYDTYEGWICLDDSVNSEIYKERPSEIVEALKKIEVVQSDNQTTNIGQSKKDKDSVIVYSTIIGIVIIIVGVTVCIIKKKWKKIYKYILEEIL